MQNCVLPFDRESVPAHSASPDLSNGIHHGELQTWLTAAKA